MYRLVCFAFVVMLAGPQGAIAQMQPHRAEYALRLGLATNAPRIGTAVQDLSQDCDGWRLKRDITTEIAITASWKLSLSSKLDGEELRSGNGFRYRIVQVQNGNPKAAAGRIQRKEGELRAEIGSPGGPPAQFTLPSPTLMPVAAMAHLVERLHAGAASFPALMFDSEVLGDAVLVEVTELDRGSIRSARPTDKAVALPKGKSWPAHLAFTRGRQQAQRPLFTVTALAFENGVLDRLTVDTGLVSVTADLQALEMRPVPNCPRS